MKDFCCHKEINGQRCGAVLGRTDGKNFYFLTVGGIFTPVVLNMVPVVCPKCKKVVNWCRPKESTNGGNALHANMQRLSIEAGK